MKKFSLIFTCFKITIKLFSIIFAVPLIVLLLKLFIDIEWLVLASISLLMAILGLIIFVFTCGYGLAVFKSIIISKIDSKGIKNVFFSLKWEEIYQVNVEHLELNRYLSYTDKRSTDCGMIVIFSKLKTENSFKKYSPRRAIAIPLNKKTKRIILKFAGNKTNLFADLDQDN